MKQQFFDQKANKVETAPKRADVPEYMTWDLTSIFEDDNAWEAAFNKLEAGLEEPAQYMGKLKESASTFLKAMKLFEQQQLVAMELMVYAHLKKDQDVTDSYYSSLDSRATQLITQVMTQWAFLMPELAQFTQAEFAEFVAAEPDLRIYEHEMDNVLRKKPHTLSRDEETILAKSSELFSAGGQIFSVLNDGDMKFPVVLDENGQEVQISHANFIKLLESRDRKVRENTFEGFFSVYEQFKNTFARVLEAQTKAHNVSADIRNFSSAREAALFDNAIPESVFDQLVKTVNDNLHVLHRYVTIRKQQMQVETLHSYDLYVPTVDSVDYSIEFEGAQPLLLKALAPLGDEYLSILRKAFAERWIDWSTNQGKRSGAYSSGSYSTKPYILMSWQGTLDNLFTLAHELGHSVHSYLTRKNQPQVYGRYSIFLAEIASITNEIILAEYLLKTEKDPEVRRFIVNHYLDGFKGSVFRQTQFAEFEHTIHQKLSQGQPLTAEFLSELYGELNRKYYGESLHFDEKIALEWARIPHFYYNYYVYQYATGFSAATAFAKRILAEGEVAVQDYIGYLSAGCSDYPIEVLRKAGLDMNSPKPIEDAVKTFEYYLDMFEELSR